MPIANCKKCGRMFNRVSRDICPDCFRKEDELLTEIRRYLKSNSQAGISEVCDHVDVEYETIIEMIRDGRLILRDFPNMHYPCERCGKPTQSGRLCGSCTAELAHGLSKATGELKEKNREQTKENMKRSRGYYSR